MNNQLSNQLRLLLMREGVTSASQIAHELSISQASVSRLIRGTPDIVRIAGGRSTRYGLRRPAIGGKSHWTLYHINEQGNATEIGNLYAIYGGPQGLWWLEHDNHWPALKHGEFKSGIYEDLPWFLMDFRPQGYIGRQFAYWANDHHGLPANPTNWDSNQIVWSLLEHGSDIPGAFLLGDRALREFYSSLSTPSSVAVDSRLDQYLSNVEKLQQGEIVGSSAGGEQPKFTALYHKGTQEYQHVLVKFSPPTHQPNGRRWADLLIAESHAVNHLSEITGHPTRTEILQTEDRLFLEYPRFDRIGLGGRKATVSLEAIDGAFVGINGRPWPEAAQLLNQYGLISPGDVETILMYWHFGCLIGNRDMHYGNLSFFLNPAFPLTVCPPYDMLPMLYTPSSTGEIIAREFNPELPLPRERDLWQRAAQAAVDYWQQLREQSMLSEEFRRIAQENYKTLKNLVQQAR